MPAKYAPLTEYLRGTVGQDVAFDFATLAQLVGGLPPSAAYPAWWANTPGNTQAQAWLTVGRRARVDLAARTVVFSILTSGGNAIPRLRVTPRTPSVLNGISALDAVLRRAGYPSTVAAMAEHTIFLDPLTVAQTHGHPVFPVIRDMVRRGTFDTTAAGRHVLLDDNTTPMLTFLWAANRNRGPDVQYNHVWSESKNPDLYTALWNLCATPAFLAKTTDGLNHPEVREALRFRAYELYGAHPPGQAPPTRPEGYEDLQWAPMPKTVPDLAAAFRVRLLAAPKSRPSLAAGTIGWLFSDWKPDTSLLISAQDTPLQQPEETNPINSQAPS
jgi:hypothetical protein